MALFGSSLKSALGDPQGMLMPQQQMPDIGQMPTRQGFGQRLGGFLGNPNPLFGAGTAILAASGNPIGEGLFAFQQQQRRNRDDEIDAEYRRAQIEAMNRRDTTPKVMSGPNGSILSVDPATQQVTPIYEGQQAPTTLQRQFEWLKSLPEEDQKAARAMLPGFGYTPEGINMTVERAAAVADAQGAARAAHRAPPSGGGGQYEYRMGPNGQLQRRRIN